MISYLFYFSLFFCGFQENNTFQNKTLEILFFLLWGQPGRSSSWRVFTFSTASNPCLRMSCHFMCLLNPTGARCICPEGKVLVNGTCSDAIISGRPTLALSWHSLRWLIVVWLAAAIRLQSGNSEFSTIINSHQQLFITRTKTHCTVKICWRCVEVYVLKSKKVDSFVAHGSTLSDIVPVKVNCAAPLARMEVAV